MIAKAAKAYLEALEAVEYLSTIPAEFREIVRLQKEIETRQWKRWILQAAAGWRLENLSDPLEPNLVLGNNVERAAALERDGLVFYERGSGFYISDEGFSQCAL